MKIIMNTNHVNKLIGTGNNKLINYKLKEESLFKKQPKNQALHK